MEKYFIPIILDTTNVLFENYLRYFIQNVVPHHNRPIKQCYKAILFSFIYDCDRDYR